MIEKPIRSISSVRKMTPSDRRRGGAAAAAGEAEGAAATASKAVRQRVAGGVRAVTAARAALSSGPPAAFSTVSMHSAISSMSCSFMPRVVTAGVPRRMPEAWKGERVSNGTVFLLHVRWARSRVSWAFFAVRSGRLARRSTSSR